MVAIVTQTAALRMADRLRIADCRLEFRNPKSAFRNQQFAIETTCLLSCGGQCLGGKQLGPAGEELLANKRFDFICRGAAQAIGGDVFGVLSLNSAEHARYFGNSRRRHTQISRAKTDQNDRVRGGRSHLTANDGWNSSLT